MKIKRNIVLLAAVIQVALLGCGHERLDRVCYQSYCIGVEVADSPEKRTHGLMFREQLGKDNGMLFVFETEGQYPFWMKNTLIPLDIVWINKNGEVVFVKNDAQPCGNKECFPIESPWEALYVLECTAGTANRIGLHRGSHLEIFLNDMPEVPSPHK
jgi:uncharacterized membrane protein (UPF0127 family)